LFLTFIVAFRFWKFRNGHKDPPCGVIIFEMRYLNVMTHARLGNELGRIPSGLVRLAELLTRQFIRKYSPSCLIANCSRFIQDSKTHISITLSI
jgi:hypothetical protein